MPGRITTSQPIFVPAITIRGLEHGAGAFLQQVTPRENPGPGSAGPLGCTELLGWSARPYSISGMETKRMHPKNLAGPCCMQIISTQGQVENFSTILADSPLHFLLTPSVPHPSPSFRTRLPLLPVSICSLLPRHKLGKGSKFSHSLNRFQDEPPPSPVLTSFITVKIIMNRNVEGENLLGIVLLSYMKSS